MSEAYVTLRAELLLRMMQKYFHEFGSDHFSPGDFGEIDCARNAMKERRDIEIVYGEKTE